MNLIEEPKKPYLRQIKPGESEFRYLEKATDEYSKLVRYRLNKYFANIEDETSRRELKSRFKQDFTSAYFELLIHQLFFNNKFKLSEHPEVPGTERRPDFLVSKDDESMYVECKEFKDLSDEERAIEKAKNSFLYQLSILKSPFYLYNIEKLVITSHKLPDLSSFFNELQDILTEKPRNGAEPYDYIHASPEYRSETFYVGLRITLKHNWEEGIVDDELLGWHMGNARFDFSEKSLKRGISDKMLRYGSTDRPLLVTLNVNSIWFSKKYEFENILYRSGVHVIDDVNGDYTEYNENGLFYELKEKIRHVMGVLVVFMGNPYNTQSDYYFYRNPFFEGDIESIAFLDNTRYKCFKFEYGDNIKIQPLLE